MSKFSEIFEDMSRVNDRTIVFMDFLDFVIAGFNINPDYEFKWRGKYDDGEGKFYELFQELVKELEDKLSSGEPYYDFLGDFYEEVVQAKAKASSMGQFFTPPEVSTLLSRLAIEDDDEEVKRVYDCASGSGRLLLAYHSMKPDHIIIADELDEVSAKMCTINFILHGVRGAVRCMDSITQEFYFGFKTNEMMEYGANGSPHCMDISELHHALVFFGESYGEIVQLKDDGDTGGSEVVPAGQTTLI